MRNNRLRCLLFLLVWTIFGSTLVAQEMVFNALPSQKSIVRPVDPSRTLVYNQPSATKGQFVLISSVWAREFELPDGLLVNDFEVEDGQHAWFCGSIYGYPTVGHFDINTTFNGTDSVAYAVHNTIDSLKFVSFDRMDLVRTSPSRMSLAMVGRTRKVNSGDVVYPTVISADLNGMGSSTWRILTGYNMDRNVWYSDITELDSVVVAVGTDSLGLQCYVKPYWRTPDFLYHPCQLDRVHLLRSNKTEGVVLIAKSGSMTASTAQYTRDRQSILSHRIDFRRIPCQVLGAAAIDFKDAYTLPLGYDTTGMRLLELCYWRRQDCPVLLHRGFHPTPIVSTFALDSWLVSLRTPSPQAYRLDFGDECSLGILTDISAYPYTSGVSHMYGMLDIFRQDLPEANRCRTDVPLVPQHPTVEIVTEECRQWNFCEDFDIVYFYPLVTEVRVNVECKR